MKQGIDVSRKHLLKQKKHRQKQQEKNKNKNGCALQSVVLHILFYEYLCWYREEAEGIVQESTVGYYVRMKKLNFFSQVLS